MNIKPRNGAAENRRPNVSFAPFRGLGDLHWNPTVSRGFTVGYDRSLLRSYMQAASWKVERRSPYRLEQVIPSKLAESEFGAPGRFHSLFPPFPPVKYFGFRVLRQEQIGGHAETFCQRADVRQRQPRFPAQNHRAQRRRRARQ